MWPLLLGCELLNELIRQNVKVTIKDIIFITKDKSGQLIWLEKGNNNAGLQHIINRHLSDFNKTNGVNESTIVEFLYNVLSNGEIISSKPSKYANGLDKIYNYDNNYYLIAGIGSNGFIVTAFPIPK